MPGRVLVVDDAATVRFYHGSLLREAGFAVTEATNGFEAVEVALAHDFDLFIVDVNMPKMDGYTCVETLRRSEPAATASIMMVSTEQQPDDAARAYAAGANLYLVKPVDADKLVRMARLLTSTAHLGDGTDA